MNIMIKEFGGLEEDDEEATWVSKQSGQKKAMTPKAGAPATDDQLIKLQQCFDTTTALTLAIKRVSQRLCQVEGSDALKAYSDQGKSCSQTWSSLRMPSRSVL